MNNNDYFILMSIIQAISFLFVGIFLLKHDLNALVFLAIGLGALFVNVNN